jgi:unsaturated chondroitin disaccharide hydrolase
MKINESLSVHDLQSKIERLWEVSAEKITAIEKEFDHAKGSPVFTVAGKYTTRGWTEWTQGFEFGSSILQFDATGDHQFLTAGRNATVEKMATHVGHFGVHDHGFNNVSTYGNLLRLMLEEKIPYNEWEKNFYELALQLSGAVQAKRWTPIKDGGFIYSFNGPHSLFVDTIRTLRALIVSHELGYALFTENDARINLLERAILHAKATAKYSVYYGKGRDSYDIAGRTAHESVFNVNDGNYRCPNSQQGYSGFSTWTRGLAWAMAGFAEQLEYIETLSHQELEVFGGFNAIESIYLAAAKATCDFYIFNTPTDGIPYWDTGAPQLYKLTDYNAKPADPYNAVEPVDSSAAAIAAQGLLRLGRYLEKSAPEEAMKYWQAGLTVLNTLFDEPYLSTDANHQGLILHSVYHRPNGWDHIPAKGSVPQGESSMWGDYHAREVALYVHRILKKEPYYSFMSGLKEPYTHG